MTQPSSSSSFILCFNRELSYPDTPTKAHGIVNVNGYYWQFSTFKSFPYPVLDILYLNYIK